MQTRKPNRLKGYNYSCNGAYFITICTKDKQCILGKVVGDGVLDVPKMILSEQGRIIDKHITDIKGTYKHIFIENYVIMPNHIHLLVMLYNKDNILQSRVSDTPQNADIPKLISTLKRFVNKNIGYNIWQRSYHDHIIRNEEEYNTIWEYVEYNASKWKSDCFFSE